LKEVRSKTEGEISRPISLRQILIAAKTARKGCFASSGERRRIASQRRGETWRIEEFTWQKGGKKKENVRVRRKEGPSYEDWGGGGFNSRGKNFCQLPSVFCEIPRKKKEREGRFFLQPEGRGGGRSSLVSNGKKKGKAPSRLR